MERFGHRRWPIARPEASRFFNAIGSTFGFFPSRLAPPQAAPAVSILDMTPWLPSYPLHPRNPWWFAGLIAPRRRAKIRKEETRQDA